MMFIQSNHSFYVTKCGAVAFVGNIHNKTLWIFPEIQPDIFGILGKLRDSHKELKLSLVCVSWLWEFVVTGQLIGRSLRFWFMFHTETEAMKYNQSKLWSWSLWLNTFYCFNRIKCTSRALNWKEHRQDLQCFKLLAERKETETTVGLQWGHFCSSWQTWSLLINFSTEL